MMIGDTVLISMNGQASYDPAMIMLMSILRICVSQWEHIQSGEKRAWLRFLDYLIDDDDDDQEEEEEENQLILPGHV